MLLEEISPNDNRILFFKWSNLSALFHLLKKCVGNEYYRYTLIKSMFVLLNGI